MKSLTFKGPIGKLPIYDEMRRCGFKIFDVFTRHGGPPVLIAQMQQGKTGTIIVVIDQFIKNCEDENTPYEVIYLTNIADNSLRGQTDQRLIQAGLSSKVKLIHHAQLRDGKYDSILNPIAKRRLFIVDECHLALGKDRPLHNFFKMIGVTYGESIDTWKNKENYVLSVSATPYAHVLKAKLDAKAFEEVVLEVSTDYYSLKNMYESGRLRQSDQVVRNKTVTPFFEIRMQEFVASCGTDGGYMVVRATGKSPELLENYIRSQYSNVDVRTFESAPINNIDQLDDILSTEPPHPFVAIIRGTLRAGKTLSTTKNIRMWLEPPRTKTDAMCQVVGRCVGFEMENGKNRRKEDTFPLYCNISEVNEAITFFEERTTTDRTSIPTGNCNTSTDRDIQVCELEILNATTIEELHQNYPNTFSVSTNSKTNQWPVEEIILKKQIWGRSKNIEDKERVFYLDNQNSNRPNDWKHLTMTRPDLIGKFVRLKMIGEKVERNYSNKISEDCIFA
jgi:hypothetical protein